MATTTNAPGERGFTVDPGSAPFTAEDVAILGQVDASIAQGHELKEWWTANRDTRVRLNSVPIARQIHEPDINYGFLVDAHLKSGTLPVAGVVQDQLFRWPKMRPDCPRDPHWMKAQLREFVLKYFMRMAGTQPPLRADYVGTVYAPAEFRSDNRPREGWGYRQVYYKLASTGAIGKFPADQQPLIVPLDEVGPKYSWIVFQVNIYHFDMSFGVPGAPNGPSVNLSMTQPVHTVMTPEFLVDEENPDPGIVGRYGYGYSVVPNPAYHTLMAASPSSISNTIETLSFRVLESGAVRAHMNFITPQPTRILNVDPVQLAFDMADRLSFNTASKVFGPLKTLLAGLEPQIDPIYLSIHLLNAMTAGVAREEFGISKQTLFKSLMNLHFTDVYKMYNLAASHFAMVRDWADPSALPAWATTGVYTPPGEG